MIELVVREQDVLRLHVTVNDPFVFHEFQALANLLGNYLQLLWVESLLGSLVHFLILVKIKAETVEDDDHMLPESEVVNHVHQALVAFVVIIVRRHQLLQQADLHIGIVHVKLFVLADLRSNYSLIWILVINTFDNLAKGTLIYGPDHLIPVTYLLSLFYKVLALLIGNRILVLPPDLPDGVNALKHAHLDLLELRQIILEEVERVLRAVAHLLALLPAVQLRVEGRHSHRIGGAVRAGRVRVLPGGVARVLRRRARVQLLLLAKAALFVEGVAELAVGLGGQGAEGGVLLLLLEHTTCDFGVIVVLGLVLYHWSTVLLTVLACSELSREPVLLLVVHLVFVAWVLHVWRLLHHIAREYVLYLIS